MKIKVCSSLIVLSMVGCSSSSFKGTPSSSTTSKSGDAVQAALSPSGAATAGTTPTDGNAPGAQKAASSITADDNPGVGGGGDKGGSGDKGSGDKGSGANDSPGANGGVLNPNATAADPSGIGGAISTTGDGMTPFKGPLADDPATTKMVGGKPGQVLTPSQTDSVKSCMKMWGWTHPFSRLRTRPDKIIFGNIEVGPANRLIDAVLGTEFSGITDEEVTAQPSLILVIASINLAATNFILPEVTYKFHNPKGWYCLNFSLEIASSIKVELKKGAHLADSRLNLSILSNSQAVAAHQVSILSKMSVVTVP